MKIKYLLLLLFCLPVFAVAQMLPTQPVIPISVSLTGYVENPGVYQLSPLNRLSDLLAMDLAISAEAAKNSILPEIPQPKPNDLLSPVRETQDMKLKFELRANQALRSIKIIRSGKTETYDLLRFYRLGEIEQNPYLKDSDVVVVEAISNFVSISGGVNLPGELEFKRSDTLSDIIALAKGFSFDADPAKIQLYQYKANRIDYEVITLNFNDGNSTKSFAISPEDRIIVARDSEIRSKQRVKISGQVKNPGEYVIDKETSLYDVVLQAGGITKRADLKSLVYYNENLSQEPDPYMEMLMQRSMSDMTPLEYSYLRTSLMQLKGKYSIDGQKLAASEGKEANPPLHDGDHIFIPELMDMVWVSGQVRFPGLVPWVEGKKWDYYIAAAGGYANNRKMGKGRLIRGQSGNWVSPKKDLPILPGDTVFVPSQTDRSLWTDVKDIVTLTSSMITIIIGLRALTVK